MTHVIDPLGGIVIGKLPGSKSALLQRFDVLSKDDSTCSQEEAGIKPLLHQLRCCSSIYAQRATAKRAGETLEFSHRTLLPGQLVVHQQ